MIYLLDTDILITMICGFKPSPRPKQQRERAVHLTNICETKASRGATIGLSAITFSELEFGAHLGGDYEAEAARMQSLLTPFTMYDYDAVNCSKQYGLLRFQLAKQGQPIGATDTLIAAHAMALSATLITNNLKHFGKIKGLKIENWIP